jgi:GMP reductase
MRIIDDIKLDFSNVLIQPKRSELGSRSEVSLEREIIFKYSGFKWTGIPIIVANMDTTGTVATALALQKHKIITCLHKFHKWEDIPETLDPNYYMVSTGITPDDLINLDLIVQNRNPHFICIDVANGYSSKFLDVIKKLREKYPTKTLMGGNIVTREMAEELIINGKLDVVKVGLGNGSVCTTRLLTGVGYPQLSAVMECSDAVHGINAHMISDGGIQVVGDLGKAFGAGADFIMCGSMFAGHDESNGELVEENGKKYKMFYGMSSETAMNKYHGGVSSYRSAEGKTVKVLYKGSVDKTILNMLGGIRSTMTYIGAKRLKDIPKCTTFIRVYNQVNNIYSN